MRKIDQLTNSYSLSKTLQLALLPVGKTEENFNKNYFQSDVQRDKEYTLVKEYIDRFHISFINEALSVCNLDEEGLLSEYANLYYIKERTDEERERLEELETLLRSKVVKAFKADKKFGKLFGKDMICELLPKFLKDEEEIETVSHFFRFTTYFSGFNKNRENLYSEEAKSTSIAYRCVNDNLPKFLDNAKVFHELVIQALDENNIKKFDNNFYNKTGLSFADFFSVESFSSVLSQSGIDIYNSVIGGWSKENGEKIKGMNEYINLYNQRVAKDEKGKRLPLLKPLYKQLLSERQSMSFAFDKFDSDQEVLDAIYRVYTKENESYGSIESTIDEIKNLFTDLCNYDYKKIYLKSSAINDVSLGNFGKWNILSNAWKDVYDKTYITSKTKVNEKYIEKRNKAFKAIKSFSLYELQELGQNVSDSFDIINYYRKEVFNSIISVRAAYANVEELLITGYSKDKQLRKNENAVGKIKNFLDSILALENLVKPFAGSGKEGDKDELFYGKFASLFDTLHQIDGIYNKTRNYLTKKPYSKDKIRLNFDTSTFLSGWAQDYTSKGAIFVEKDGQYYLMVLDKKLSADDVTLLTTSETENMADRIVYKYQKSDNKNIPRLFIYSSAVKKYNLPLSDVKEIYDNGWFKTEVRKTNPELYKKSLVKLIDYYKFCLSVHDSFKDFNFQWKPSEEYRDISEFYADVQSSTYMLEKERISFDVLLKFVDEEKIYLFQLWTKDFSENSKGMPQLQTMYFKMLFDERNLKNVIYALNGGAEMFYRPSSIQERDKIVHPANQPIKNKNPLNTKKESVFAYDIVKDRRFTKSQFSIHIPITMNFKEPSRTYNLNTTVRGLIKNDPDTHIIAIDRGERNLLFIAVINSNGEIVEQFSLNQIVDENIKTDYYKLLENKEAERMDARKNWTAVRNIKELKEGYLSQVIHKICQLVEKYDAIIVMEDLDSDFKNKRVKIEKSIYQKFETMLVNKLSYYVNKKTDIYENGGLLKAYQLASRDNKDKFQNGIIFKVGTSYTSNIDPVTGFVDMLRSKYTSRQNAVELFDKFEDISYSSDDDMFKFTFDYKKFGREEATYRTLWTVYTNGERIYNFRNADTGEKWESKYICLTDEFKILFDKYKIHYDAGNLKEQICSQTDADFFKQILSLLSLTLQMKNNATTNGDINFFISPVKDYTGTFFDSRNYEDISDAKLPQNTFANDAYNIARKGLWAVNNFKAAEGEELFKAKSVISNKEWLELVQRTN